MSKMRSTTIVIDKVLKIMTRKCPAASGDSPVSVGVPLGNSLGDGQRCHALALPRLRMVAAIWMVICAVGLSGCAAFDGRVSLQCVCHAGVAQKSACSRGLTPRGFALHMICRLRGGDDVWDAE